MAKLRLMDLDLVQRGKGFFKKTIMKKVTLKITDKDDNQYNYRCYVHYDDNTVEIRLLEKI